MNRNEILECIIEDGVLVMRIGVDALAHVTKLNPAFAELDEETGDWVEPEITDVDKFAAEVLAELKRESEDGTTLVHLAIDKAANNAIENGAEGIRLPSDRS